MKNKFKKITLAIVASIIAITSIPIVSYAAGDGGEGYLHSQAGYGPWHRYAFFVKCDFVSPKTYQLTKDPKSWEYAGLTGDGTEQNKFKSLTQALFFKRTTSSAGMMPLPRYEKGGEDAAELCQLYLACGPHGTDATSDCINIGCGNRHVYTANFIYDKGVKPTADSTGHKAITTRSESWMRNHSWNEAGHMFSNTNPIVRDLMLLTDNGRVWDNTQMPKYIKQMWDKYVWSTSAQAVNLRKDLMCMFNEDSSWKQAAADSRTLFEQNLKKDSNWMGVGALTEVQASHIGQFYQISMAITLANPYLGVFEGGSYKGDAILKKMQNWAAYGGNSDQNDQSTHFGIRVDMCVTKQPSNGHVTVWRWDILEYTSATGLDKSKVALPLGYADGGNPSSLSFYGFGDKVNEGNSNEFYSKELFAIRNFYKTYRKTIPVRSGPASVDNWTILQKPYLPNNTSSIIDNQYKSYNWRRICAYNNAGYYNGGKTIGVGFTYIMHSGRNPGTTSGSEIPNFKVDAVAATEEAEIPKGTNAECEVQIDMTWPKVLSDQAIEQQDIKLNTSEWRDPKTELRIMNQFVHRIQEGELVNPNDPNKLLPVTMTITKTVENGTLDGAVIDELRTEAIQVAKCGDHNIQYRNISPSQAEITFNIIPNNSDHSCGVRAWTFVSPLFRAQGKTGNDLIGIVDNCVIHSLMEDSRSKVKFKDTDLQITDIQDGKTVYHYDIEYSVGLPKIKENVKAYGNAETDKLRAYCASNSEGTGKGHKVLPDGEVYPKSDYKKVSEGYGLSPVIRRSVTFIRAREMPHYSNFGYELKTPPYAEIKAKHPTFEPYEAMAGVPTMRNLYGDTDDIFASVGATEFRVDFNSDIRETKQSGATRTYTYEATNSSCYDEGTVCGSCSHNCSSTDPEHEHDPCDYHTETHHDTCTFTYTITTPINEFSFFDFMDSEVWRLTEWGFNPLENIFSNDEEDFTKKMNTKVWAFNGGLYSSGSGRILYSAGANGAEECASDMHVWGDCIVKTSVSGNHVDASEAALNWANSKKNAEKPWKAMVLSDYVVMKTSEGFQMPYYNYQMFAEEISPSSLRNFTGENDSITTEALNLKDGYKTIDDLWYFNEDSTSCASVENNWDNTSITYAGYNGKYFDMNDKYNNVLHSPFIDHANVFEKSFKDMNWDIQKHIPNACISGTGDFTPAIGKSNKEHIIKDLDIIDTTPNKEYDMGNAWLKYERIMFYDNNSSSNGAGKFESNSGNDVYINPNVPYYEQADKVNNIVVHNPVSTEEAIVISNPPEYDLRTNAEIKQGGDPVIPMGGVCPVEGCQFSTLNCSEEIKPHTDDCYDIIDEHYQHSGGFNVHNHDTENCFSYTHHHNKGCLKTYDMYWDHRDCPDCPFDGEIHVTTSTDGCTTCGHACGKWKDEPEDAITCSCSKCDVSYCPNYYDSWWYWHDNDHDCGPSCMCDDGLDCGKEQGGYYEVCSNELNKHVCTEACTSTYVKELICSNPHHYVPGEYVDVNSLDFHYPLGDPNCWERCGNDSNHTLPDEIVLPGKGITAKFGGTFINLDREFTIYYPFTGDFADDPSLRGIPECTDTRGYGYVNNMDCKTWTAARWVKFPVNVLDENGIMHLAYEHINLNNLPNGKDKEYFTFYCVLANNEYSEAEVKFTSVANNSVHLVGDPGYQYYDESVDVTNKDRVDPDHSARHTGHKYHDIDVVGSIGSLALNDTGDFRFSNFFKEPDYSKEFLIPNIVPDVDLSTPNNIVADVKDVRHEDRERDTRWLDTYGNLFKPDGGKSSGLQNDGTNIYNFPLTPMYNKDILDHVMNQPMRPGYNMYMEVETIGNYYGETLATKSNTEGELDNSSEHLSDINMQQRMYIKPLYYSLNLDTGNYTPVDVYYGAIGDYVLVNDYTTSDSSATVTDDTVDYYYYVDWINESARRNHTNNEDNYVPDIDPKPIVTNEAESTSTSKNFRDTFIYSGSNLGTRSLSSDRDVIGSANELFLNDLNRNFIGSSSTYTQDYWNSYTPDGIVWPENRNQEGKLNKGWFNSQGQRWHFTIGLPSSSVFVEAGKECTESNIKELATDNRVIVGTLDIKVEGEVWKLQYDGTHANSNTFDVFEDDGRGPYGPPYFEEDGTPSPDPEESPTKDDIVVVVYDPDRTSADDVIISGTH